MHTEGGGVLVNNVGVCSLVQHPTLPVLVVPPPSDDGGLLAIGLGGVDTEALAALSLAIPGQVSCLFKTWQHAGTSF